MGHRMSLLPITQRCGQAGRLSSLTSQANTAMGTAWHAHNLKPGSEESKAAFAKLSAEEVEEVLSWGKPADIETPHGWLRYDHCWKEQEVALDLDGEHCRADDSRCVTVGHVDMHQVMPGGEYVYVVDPKRSEWTVQDGPESLQLHAYGLACASKFRCRYYVLGIWGCIERRWWWAERAVDVWSDEADDIRQRVVRAALSDGGSHAIGAHCRGCYGRALCPAWLMPPELAESSLAPLAAGELALTNDVALQLLLTVQRAEDTVKKAKDILKEWSLQNGGIVDDGSGKRWGGVRMPGRETLNRAALAQDGVDISKYMRTGKDYEQMRWVNK